MSTTNNFAFFVMTKKATNQIANNNETQQTLNLIKDILKQYAYREDDILNYKESIDYKTLFLNLYYVTVYLDEQYMQIEADAFGHPSHGMAILYFEQQMIKHNIYKTYAIRGIDDADIALLQKQYNIKTPPHIAI